MEDLSTDFLRKHLGEVFEKVLHAGKKYSVKRKGKTIGVIIPVEYYEHLQMVLKQTFQDFIETQKKSTRNMNVSDNDIMSTVNEEIAEIRLSKKRK